MNWKCFNFLSARQLSCKLGISIASSQCMHTSHMCMMAAEKWNFFLLQCKMNESVKTFYFPTSTSLRHTKINMGPITLLVYPHILRFLHTYFSLFSCVCKTFSFESKKFCFFLFDFSLSSLSNSIIIYFSWEIIGQFHPVLCSKHRQYCAGSERMIEWWTRSRYLDF